MYWNVLVIRPYRPEIVWAESKHNGANQQWNSQSNHVMWAPLLIMTAQLGCILVRNSWHEYLTVKRLHISCLVVLTTQSPKPGTPTAANPWPHVRGHQCRCPLLTACGQMAKSDPDIWNFEFWSYIMALWLSLSLASPPAMWPEICSATACYSLSPSHSIGRSHLALAARRTSR